MEKQAEANILSLINQSTYCRAQYVLNTLYGPSLLLLLLLVMVGETEPICSI
jgi:hypothetical protein